MNLNPRRNVPVWCRTLLGAALFLALSATESRPIAAQDVDAEGAVRGVLMTQQEAWNRGDVEGFMDGYWRSDSLRFASGGTVQQGWQATLDRYHEAYPDRAAMGRLTFSLYSVEILSEDDAFVFGRYELERASDHPTGLFTLLFRRFGEDWRIVFDHTSADPTNDGDVE